MFALFIVVISGCTKKGSSPNLELGFDLAKFTKQSDSLISELAGKPISLLVEVDSVKKDSGIVHISFDPGKGNRSLRFSISQYTFTDSIKLAHKFDSLRLAGTTLSSDTDISGLTYTNDYLCKTKNRIYWINTKCYYADFNHEKLKSFMIKSFKNEVILDSLICWCGSSCREFQTKTND